MASRLALVILSAFASLVSVSADSLSLKVTGPVQVDDISDLHIKTALKNTGTSALTLVNDPGSVLSRRPTDIFTISHESGGNPEFMGMLVKYSFDLAAKGGAVTTLNPGQSIEVTHSVAGTYNFTKSGPGTYEILPSTFFHAVSKAGYPQPIYANLENSYTVAISGSGQLSVPRKPRRLTRNTRVIKRAVFEECTAAQEELIKFAVPGASGFVLGAISYLDAHTNESERFKTWFGSFTDPHRIKVLGHFNSLNAPGMFTTWTYDCSLYDCDEGDYAYVERTEYGVIHLCSQFWATGSLGTDSRPGTLVHEALHFERTADLRDILGVIGQDRCMALARDNPDQAILNPDSHQYFAENWPALE